MKKMLSALLLWSAILSPAMADDIRLGEPGYGGSGCPSGTASVTLSPDQKSLSIIFDEFLVEAGASSGKRMNRKNCNLAIPVHVPQGLSISVIDVDYRGFVSLPSGTMAQFNAEYFFAGMRGPRFTKRFSGALDQDYLLTNTLGVQASIWSPCGKDVNLRVNSAMLVRSNRYGDDALATVDTADFKAGILYKLQWKKCNASDDNDFDPWRF